MKNETFLKYLENLIEIKIQIAQREAAYDYRMSRTLRIEELEPLRKDMLMFLEKEKGDI